MFLFNQMLSAFFKKRQQPRSCSIKRAFWRYFQYIRRLLFRFRMLHEHLRCGFGCDYSLFNILVIMLTRFLRKKNTPRLVKPEKLFSKLKKYFLQAFSYSSKMSHGLFNGQIMKRLYSVCNSIINISTFFKCCAYSADQASQTIISANYGAGNFEITRKTLTFPILTTVFFLGCSGRH